MKKDAQKLLKDLRANKISGLEFGLRHAQIMDAHITKLSEDFSKNDIAIIATGGYGRSELCPYSDIDILFLTGPKPPEDLNENIEKFLYTIWDSGIKIGHAVRTIKECITVSKDDAKALSSLLDARLITGNQTLFDDFQTSLYKSLKPRNKKDYFKGKLDERDIRHNRLGNSRYKLEPNIKDGKGGLRDYQTLFWIARVIYEATSPKSLEDLKIITKRERKRFEKDYEFLLTVRCHMHDIAGRAEERLHFDIQPEVAKRLGYAERNNAKAVERFMKHYFLVTKDIGDLTRILVAAIEEKEAKKNRIKFTPPKRLDEFVVNGNRLGFTKDQKLKPDPLLILKFFRCAQEHNLDVHPAALQKIRRNIKFIDSLRHDKDANAIFLDMLTARDNAALALRRMNEAGVLERFIPEFARIKGLMQFDRYHAYTVDEHTLNAVQIMHKLDNGDLKEESPLASKLFKSIANRKTLYLAILLHDICKGREQKKPGEDHSTLGAELALQLCPRLSLSDQGTRLVSWLVFDHLFMAEIAFKRDLEDPKTLDDFLFRIHDLERLKLLTILTICDIMAVAPDCYTQWKESLLTELYNLAEAKLSGKDIPQIKEIKAPDLDNETAIIDITQNDDKNATQIQITTKDENGLFALLSGALTAANVNIIEARINTVDNNIAFDTFLIQSANGEQITKPHRLNEIRRTTLNILENPDSLENIISKTRKKTKSKELVFDIPEGVVIDNNASNDATYIEAYARDRSGLLYDIASALTEQNIIIRNAKINTLGLKAVDVFYVTDLKDQKITDQKRINTLEKVLKKALSNKTL